MATVNPIPDRYPRVTPHLSIAGAADAIAFYTSVLGAKERMRMAMPDGTVAHAEIVIGESVIMIGDENWPGVQEPEDHFYGDRVAMFDDPYGHRWNLGTHIEDVSPAEMERRMAEALSTA